MSYLARALSSDRKLVRSHGLQANRAFVVESLLLLLFLSIALALILRVFAVADSHARDAHARAIELHLATNAAEVFAANPVQNFSTQYCDIQGNSVDQGSEDAAFQVDMNVSDRPSEPGTMYKAQITITPLLPSLGVETYTLDTTRYVANKGDVL